MRYSPGDLENLVFDSLCFSSAAGQNKKFFLETKYCCDRYLNKNTAFQDDNVLYLIVGLKLKELFVSLVSKGTISSLDRLLGHIAEETCWPIVVGMLVDFYEDSESPE